VLLYLLMFAVPLSGWLMSSAKGFQTVWFGVLPLPDLLDKDKELGDLLQGSPHALNFGMAGLVLAHALVPRSSTTSSTATTCCRACCPSSPKPSGELK
jgi:cytochrome b561